MSKKKVKKKVNVRLNVKFTEITVHTVSAELCQIPESCLVFLLLSICILILLFVASLL